MKRRFQIITVGLAVLFAGCSLVGGGGEPSPASASLRRFGGEVRMQGPALSSMLEIRGSGRKAQAALRIPDLHLSAQGSGRVTPGSVDLSLSYGDSCPGTIRIRGDLRDEGRRIRGTITAQDCTGRQKGSVLFTLRSYDGAPSPTTPR